MRRIDFSRQAEAFLRKLPTKHASQISERIVALAAHPDGAALEPPKGHTPLMRLKSGEDRVIVEMNADLLDVLLVGKRNDDEVYKLVERLRK
ncbi:MAG: type II toxin-antitoxin system RelE/ParE family toxin [Phyllobacteriaceae bacterium]|nr:type II toxin-antitoxin system RelE/ParE family toxin [Phyllobacteriaceae bacterium]